MDSNVVSSLIWIKKGFAMANPKEFEINEADIEEMRKDPLVKKKYDNTTQFIFYIRNDIDCLFV